MAALQQQAIAFRKSLAAQSGAATATAKPSGSSSNAASAARPDGSQSGRAAARRGAEAVSSAAGLQNSAAAAASVGNHLMSQLYYAVDFLKKRVHGVSAAQIASYLSIEPDATLTHLLRTNQRVLYDPATDLYEFRPLHNIRSAESLLAYLRTTGTGLSVKEIRDGWADCISTVNELEKKGHVLVIRGKKDGLPRTVWGNDVAKMVQVDSEFKEEWHNIKIPPPASLPEKLEELGLKASSVDPATVVNAAKRKTEDLPKRRKRTHRGKITNVHLTTLRDYNGGNRLS